MHGNVNVCALHSAECIPWCHVSAHLFSCDAGFTGSLCVPEKPLPMLMKDDFESGINSNWWPEVHGADVTMPCDVVTAGQSLSFYQVGAWSAQLIVTELY